MNGWIRSTPASVFAGLLLLLPTTATSQIDPSLLGGMRARSIGPAGMSGRIVAIDAVAADPNIIVVGAATGGVWKSINGGITWAPLFDDQPVSSIGAVAIFQPNPDVIWVGTGEGTPRNSAGVGAGIYRSTDGGATWTHLGLDKSERVGRIVLDPHDPSVAYVAAMGPAWGETAERGVFKTTDGGKTWTRVLYVDEKTGAADLVMDPTNSRKLFAAMWQYRRWPWVMTSGGPGSGLYSTQDGGGTWKRLSAKDGLPAGDLGRIGLAIAPGASRVIYALVEAKKSALLRSDNGGESWRTVNDSAGVAPRPFYFSQIRVDPGNENRVYNLGSRLVVSDDGGRSFRVLAAGTVVHPDHHALWIAPSDGQLLIDGNDGGIAISRDRGAKWWFPENLPLGQFYHIAVDRSIPYNVYGGMQDNGSWRGPSEVWDITGLGIGGAEAGIRNYVWTDIGFDLDDGFNALSERGDARYAYALSQGGRLRRVDILTGERKDILPPAPDGVDLRLNWDAASALDPFDPAVVYLGSQFLHRSLDRGVTWTAISPDLSSGDSVRTSGITGVTREASSAETYATIVTIAPSPVARGLIWVGTDDGNVQVTRNGGQSWSNVSANLPGVPRGIWVSHIEPSRFAAGAAFAVLDDHRRGNWTTYVYQTVDYGRTWTSLATTDVRGFALVIAQDPVEKNLLFLGTEFGLYVSVDGGKGWFKWTHGLPTVPVRGLVVHPRDHDLVIGTHGRSAYILDDIRPLRGLSAAVLAEPLHLFQVPPAYQHALKQPEGYPVASDAMFRGENRPYGTLITYAVNPGSDTARAVITVSDSTGAVLRTIRGPARRGLNRITWDLRRDTFRIPTPPTEQGAMEGAEVLAGRYTVRATFGGREATQTVIVRPDPRDTVSMAVRAVKYAAVLRTGARMEVVGEAVERIRETTAGINRLLDAIKTRDDASASEIRAAGEGLKERLDSLRTDLMGRPGGLGDARPNPLRQLRYVYSALVSSWKRPTAAELNYLRQAETVLNAALRHFNQIYATDVPAFRRRLEESRQGDFVDHEPLSLEWTRRR